ncbi:MAG: DUF882 domain-containing protein [Deltaproteobacteria bacterium]|jgi:uncharacterized protein YcbK (DUF882 family)|nr:DUF882 domain-containing protein [Deltaproteobacteria bacterium]MBW2492975.1 DUF882 domain-containing protein [Deltaproteobacteria bacterium]
MKLSGSLKKSNLNIPFMSPKAGLSRRNFMGFMVCAGISGLFPKSVFAAIDELATTERTLSLYNPHTKDSFNGVYWRKGKYVTDALKNINHIMRDFRAHDIKQIDTHLLDLLSAMSIKLKPEKPFHVISGYRSPETNAKLRKRGKGAAKNSYHIQGKAVDIRLPGYRTSVLRRTAHKLKGGGVGYYPHQKFVHIDVGPIRYWKG